MILEPNTCRKYVKMLLLVLKFFNLTQFCRELVFSLFFKQTEKENEKSERNGKLRSKYLKWSFNYMSVFFHKKVIQLSFLVGQNLYNLIWFWTLILSYHCQQYYCHCQQMQTVIISAAFPMTLKMSRPL